MDTDEKLKVLCMAIEEAMGVKTVEDYHGMVFAMSMLPVTEHTKAAHIIWHAYVNIREAS